MQDTTFHYCQGKSICTLSTLLQMYMEKYAINLFILPSFLYACHQKQTCHTLNSCKVMLCPMSHSDSTRVLKKEHGFQHEEEKKGAKSSSCYPLAETRIRWAPEQAGN